MAGSSLDQFFTRYVRGKEELDYDSALNAAGLRLDTSGGASVPVPQTFFGADLKQDGDRLIVTKVYAGSPAYEQGLNANDQILALDNMRVTKENLLARLEEKKPGDLVRLTVFRFDDLKIVEIKLGTRNVAKYRIIPVVHPTDEQKKVYQAWLGAPFPRER